MYILEIETAKWSRPSLPIPQKKPPSLQRTNCPSIRDIEKKIFKSLDWASKLRKETLGTVPYMV